ncbi:MAG: glycosyltransferase family 2 protein, partial [Clostridiales bacterium]
AFYTILSILLTLIFNIFYESIILSILNTQILLLQIFFIVVVVYNVVISYVGTLKKDEIITHSISSNNFAILIPAHNEEVVVGKLVDSFKKSNYPKELFDVYVICDNCTDETSKVAEKSGAKVCIRTDTTKKGKGYVIEWMLDRLYKMEKDNIYYDAILIVDADNLVDKNFLKEIDYKIQEGYEVIQGYMEAKNPDDSVVTKSYSFSYWSTNRMYQLARHKLGLSAQIGGFGVAIKLDALKKVGWNSYSLTEDLEFTQRYIMKTGNPIAWAHNAIIYDEKPIGLAPSIYQRIRWKSGRINCAINYIIPLSKNTLLKKSMISFDSLMYLISPTRFSIFTLFGIMMFVNLMKTIFENIPLITNIFTFNFTLYFVLTILYLSLPIYALILENKKSQIPKLFLSYFFSLSNIPVSIIGFIKRNNNIWSHTKHTRNVDIDKKK